MKDLIGYYFSLSIFVTTRKYVSNGIKTNERRGMPVEKYWPENVHWPDGPLSIHFNWPVHNFTGHGTAGQHLRESLTCIFYNKSRRKTLVLTLAYVWKFRLIDWFLMPALAAFQPYRGMNKFYTKFR